MVFDEKKLKSVLHYIIHKCDDKFNIGKTVLHKLLYFSDFDFYELYEEKMTGETYIKYPKGPVSDNFSNIIDELEKEKSVEVGTFKYPTGHTQFVYNSLKEPDTSNLSEKEINVIDNVLKRCSNMNASTISEYSHGDLPWQATEDHEIIDYELVFYRSDKFSVRDYEENA